MIAEQEYTTFKTTKRCLNFGKYQSQIDFDGRGGSNSKSDF